MSENANVVYITAEGLQRLEDELKHLTTEKREELARRLQTAIAQGDLKENADYHATKEEQAFVEMRIREIEDSLRRAEVIKDAGPSDVVRVGSTVTIVEDGYDDEETYSIVGVQEADPANGRISNESPLGRALLGARVGHTVRVSSPAGVTSFKVRAIS